MSRLARGRLIIGRRFSEHAARSSREKRIANRYLANKGDPIALCALASHEPDRAVRVHRAGPYTASFWVKVRVAWVLIGNQDAEILSALVQRIRGES